MLNQTHTFTHRNCVKVLLVLFLFNLIRLSRCVELPDLTLIIKDLYSNRTESICIAEANVLNTGIGWIFPIESDIEKLPKIDNEYVPNINKELNCNFVKTEHCNNFWKLDGWHHSKVEAFAYKPILDTRWESFPTYLTSNKTKEFSTRIDIPDSFEVGISIRAAKNAEILICEGWDPHNYPCYYLNIGSSDNKQIFLRKYESLPNKLSKNDTKLAKYKSESGILSEDEWKNYALRLYENGTLTLLDIHRNILLINYRAKPIKPINLLMRSKFYNALWKIHKNEYIYTNTAKTIPFGPTFQIYGNNLCVALYVALCKNCGMSFFIKYNDQQKILKEIQNKGDEIEWKEIKLLYSNILDDNLQLFVETKFLNDTNRTGFWAVDDVRICIENELKVSRLLTLKSLKETQKTPPTCQVLNYPIWRPSHHVFSSSSANELTYNSTKSTSIRLSWTGSGGSIHSYQEYYLIQYEGMDICRPQDAENLIENKSRKKSKGYVVDKGSSIIIKDLIPYTNYNVIIHNIIDDNKNSYEISTMATDVPTKEELPRNIKIKPEDNEVAFSWPKPKCNETYGPILYKIEITDFDHIHEETFVDVKTNYTIKGLKPYTNYTLKIRSTRRIENLNNTKLSILNVYSFATQPGLAPKVKNLELYSIDKYSASLRFDLPDTPGGLPIEAQIQWCHPLYESQCNFDIRNLTKCKLWDNRYCIDVNSLIVGYDYKFLVSIKNEDTFTFGAEVAVKGIATDRVPGEPTNITYRMVDCKKSLDYCHLNVSWDHPYYPNGTITKFDILLYEASFTDVGDTIKRIYEILPIEDKKYKKAYSYIIKYITYNTPYLISIRAANDVYKGNTTSLHIKTDNIMDYIDQTPEYIRCTNETMSFQLPPLDWRLNSSTLVVIVQDYDPTKTYISDDVLDLEMFDNKNKLCNNFGDTWIAKEIKLSKATPPIVVIGDKTSSYISQLEREVQNKPLTPSTEYCFTFILINQYKESETIVVYHMKHHITEHTIRIFAPHKNEPVKRTNVALYLIPVLILLLLISCGAWLTYRYMKKKKQQSVNNEPIYESMPFDDYFTDAVSNRTYDRLIHD